MTSPLWTRRKVLLAPAAAAGVGQLPAQAQNAPYPNRPIKIVVPVAAGGGIDGTARLYADKLSQIFKSTVVVENLPGASGQIAARAVKSARPDGYTLLWSSTSFSIFAPLGEVWPFDPSREFRMLARLLAFDLILVASPSLGVGSIKDLLTLIRRESVPWGNAGLITTVNIAATAFNELANGKGIAIPYSGSAPALNALMGGHIGFMFNSLDNVKQLIQSGKLLGLASLTNERLAGMNIPTMAEAGFPEMMAAASWELWYGAQAPIGVPSQIVETLNHALYDASTDPRLRETFDKMGLRVLPRMSPEEADKTVNTEIEQFRPIIKRVLAGRAKTS